MTAAHDGARASVATAAGDPAQHDATLPTRLADHARRRSHDVAFRFVKRESQPARELTWGELWSLAGATSARLSAVAPTGARIGIACEDPADTVTGIAACFIGGYVAVPMPVSLSRRSAPRAAAVAKSGRLGGLLVSRDSAVVEWMADAGTLPAAVEVEREASGPFAPSEPPARDALALIQFTSGSTGQPKGIALTHGNLAANCDAIAATYGLSAATRGLSWLPLHHDMGLVGHVLVPMWLGCQSTVMDPLRFLQRPLSWLRLVKTEAATIVSTPNFALELCTRTAEREPIADLDLSSLTTIVCGGEPVLRGTVERFLATFGPAGLNAAALAPSYGLAEATLLVSSGQREAGPAFASSPASAASFVANLGHPVAGTRVRILDDAGDEVSEGTIGEIAVSGDSVGRVLSFDGHFGTATELRTGDLGLLKERCLYVTGRKSDLIILRGQNVHPEDIEQAAQAASPLLAAGGVAAVGVNTDGTQRLVLLAELERGKRLTPDERQALCRRLSEAVATATGQVPAEILLVAFGSLPRTSSGKVRRGAAAAAYVEGAKPAHGGPA